MKAGPSDTLMKCSSSPLLKCFSSPLLEVSAQLEADRHTVRLADWQPPALASDIDYHPLDGLPEEDGSCTEQAQSCLVAHINILKWLPQYNFRANLFYDVSGGTTIALICLVQTLAHAAIATTSVIQGTYCAFIPPFVYAVFGTSPHASISSGAIAAILLADQLSKWPDINDRTALASVMALTSGLMLVMLGLFKFAFFVRFLSQSLLSGFITGGSACIIVGQMANLLGITTMPMGVGPMVTVRALLEKTMMEANIVCLVLGIAIIITLDVSMRLKKYVGGRLNAKEGRATSKPKWLMLVKICTETKELVVVSLSILFAWSTSSVDRDGIITTLLPTIGDVPPGLPTFKAPWNNPRVHELLFMTEDPHVFHRFMFGSFLVAVTTLLTTYSTSKKQALKHGYELNASQEMFALGMAGTCGSFFGSFPPSGSLSRTSLASEVGVRSQFSGLMQISVVGVSLKFLTPVLFFLPKTALAAIVLRSAWNLIDMETPRVLWHKWRPRRQGGHRRDLMVWILAFTLTILKGVIWGVGAAVVISILMIVKDAARPRMVVLGKLPGRANLWRDKEVWPQAVTEPGLLVIEFRGPLSFASADFFQEELQRIRIRYDKLEHKRNGGHVKMIILAFGSVHDLDPTAVSMLRDLFKAWQGSVQVIVADAKSRVRLLIEENFGVSEKGKKPLLDQPAFMITLDRAVEIALSRLATECTNAQDAFLRSRT